MVLGLTPAPKYSTDGTHRIIAPRETCRRAAALMERVGVTRLSDVTGLDRIGIPVWSAIRPLDAAPGISVYNGKGATSIEAKAGAMMEAIERYCAELVPPSLVRASYQQMQERGSVLDPRWLHLDPQSGYSETTEIEWVLGADLQSGQDVWVPLCAVMMPYPRERGPRLLMHSTNGLASGNTLEEAICHALAELIERDGMTLAAVRGSLRPIVQLAAAAVGNQADPLGWAAEQARPHSDLFPLIDLGSLPEPLSMLAGRFRQAGVDLVMRDITSDLGIATVSAVALEPQLTEKPLYHLGFGTHPDARVAARRAITEAAQSRLTFIQGVRDDLADAHQLAQLERSLWLDQRATPQPFTMVPSYAHQDVLDDIQLMLARLQTSGLTQAIVVDLTRPEIDIPVVKMIVPGLEHWSATHFNPARCHLGARARSYLQ